LLKSERIATPLERFEFEMPTAKSYGRLARAYSNADSDKT
jgi:hypothetical protein